RTSGLNQQMIHSALFSFQGTPPALKASFCILPFLFSVVNSFFIFFAGFFGFFGNLYSCAFAAQGWPLRVNILTCKR
ncbi:MAG: hypothetical protein IJS96_07425, partial [Schwartzia sp.]|nr:hypothetical protein [Schwartzia sp. (in: firmicutes)]